MVSVKNTIQIYGGIKMIEGMLGFIGIGMLYLFGKFLLPNEINGEEE